jgi:PBSX family phage terminase large subunit
MNKPNTPPKLTIKQKQAFYALNNPKFTRYLFDGSARSGKTLVTVLWLLNQMATIPNLRVACLRKHRNHARASLLDATIKPLLLGRPEFKIIENLMHVRHSNGSLMIIDGLDTDKRAEKILGNEFGHIFINEATQVGYDATKLAISRLSQQVQGLGTRKLILDCNPKSQMHWLYRWGVEHIDPDSNYPTGDADTWYRQNWVITDNPNLPKDTVESLKNLSGIERKRLYDGIWCSSDGLVYPEFNINRHIKHRIIPEESHYILSIDCGFSPDPMVISLFAIIEDGLHLQELYYKVGKDMSKSLGEQCAKYIGLNPTVVIDPSASSALVEMQSKGFTVKPANNRLLEGTKAVRDLFASNRITFSPEYQEIIIEELAQYEVNPKTDKPMQGTPDHFLDTLRYATMALQDIVGVSSNFYIF